MSIKINKYGYESISQSLKESGLKDETAEEVTGQIIKHIHDSGKTKNSQTTYTEKDIFEAAKKIYNFSPTSNTRLLKAIDSLDGKTDIQVSESNAKWTGTGAVINKDEREQPNDSLNMVRSSIEKIKKTDPEFTVDDIIKHLKTKNENENEASILVDDQGKVTKNKHLHDNLVAMREQGFTGKDITKATNSDAEWDKLLRTVKKTEFQRQLIQDSIEKIKKTNPKFTVDDIIKSLKKEDKLDDELENNLTAMKKQGVKAEKIIEAIRTDLTWNRFIGTVKKPSETTP